MRTNLTRFRESCSRNGENVTRSVFSGLKCAACDDEGRRVKPDARNDLLVLKGVQTCALFPPVHWVNRNNVTRSDRSENTWHRAPYRIDPRNSALSESLKWKMHEKCSLHCGPAVKMASSWRALMSHCSSSSLRSETCYRPGYSPSTVVHDSHFPQSSRVSSSRKKEMLFPPIPTWPDEGVQWRFFKL